MQPLPYRKELTVQEFAKEFHGKYSLRNFNFIMGTISDSASGFKYRRHVKKGTLTLVLENHLLGKKHYEKTTLFEVEIENPKEFEDKVFEIFVRYGKEPPETKGALFSFRLRCFDNITEEEVIVREPYYPQWYMPLTKYLDSYFEDL